MSVLWFVIDKKETSTLKPAQFRAMSDFCREVSQATFVGFLGAFLLPQIVGLETAISWMTFLKGSAWSLTSLAVAVILAGRGEDNE